MTGFPALLSPARRLLFAGCLAAVAGGCAGELQIDDSKSGAPEAQDAAGDGQDGDADAGSGGAGDGTGDDTGGGTADGEDGGDDGGGDGDTGDPSAPEWTVYDVQQGRVAPGTLLELGPLVATGPAAPFGFFLQDPAGGPHSGIWVYSGYLTGAWRPPFEGERVMVTGEVGEYTTAADASQTQIILHDGGDIVFLDVVDLPEPAVLTVAELADPATAEPWEGVLVEVHDVTVSDVDLGYNEFELAGGLRVDDLLYEAEAELGDTFATIIGPLYYGYGAHKLLPRWREDLRGRESHCITADRCIGELVVGDLVITELMANPTVGSDAANEWVEIYNAAGVSVDLAGLVLEDADGVARTLSGSVVVPAASHAVLGAGSGGSWAYAFAADGFYGALGLNNDGDHLTISHTGEDGLVVFDRVPDHASISTTAGVAVQLDPRARNPSANDAVGVWCAATSAIAGSDDLGSPGSSNRTCP